MTRSLVEMPPNAQHRGESPSAGAPREIVRLTAARRRFQMAMRGCLGALVCLAIGSCASPPRKSSAGMETFDATAEGRLPAGWVSTVTGEGNPIWEVVADASAPSPPGVLLQSGIVPKPSFPLCLNRGTSLRDGFVEVKFRTIRGQLDQAAGLVWRARDAANYYICRANALEDNVVLYKVENGKRQALDILGRTGGYGVDALVPANVWNTLRVEFQGPRFAVSLNGQQLFAVDDATFAEAGNVGLWTKADSVVAFDDFRYGPR